MKTNVALFFAIASIIIFWALVGIHQEVSRACPTIPDDSCLVREEAPQ